MCKPHPTPEPNTNELKNAILANIKELPNYWREIAPFCVDGREGKRVDASGHEINEPLYPQALGGSLNIAVVKWILTANRNNYSDFMEETLEELANAGYSIGAHRGLHKNGETASDCGFADNLAKIITTLGSKADEIWELLTQADPNIAKYQKYWDEILEQVRNANIDSIPTGKEMVDKVEENNASIQDLDGDHAELAAIVNTKHGKTLDVDKNQGNPAFNLDLWYVEEQAKDLELDVDRARLLTLGLYVATEMVLVEDKGKSRLPIIVVQ